MIPRKRLSAAAASFGPEESDSDSERTGCYLAGGILRLSAAARASACLRRSVTTKRGTALACGSSGVCDAFADLKALRPSTDELLTAARWARTHDPSGGFLGELQSALTTLGVEVSDGDI